jgi:hypothetical protein
VPEIFLLPIALPACKFLWEIKNAIKEVLKAVTLKFSELLESCEIFSQSLLGSQTSSFGLGSLAIR